MAIKIEKEEEKERLQSKQNEKEAIGAERIKQAKSTL